MIFVLPSFPLLPMTFFPMVNFVVTYSTWFFLGIAKRKQHRQQSKESGTISVRVHCFEIHLSKPSEQHSPVVVDLSGEKKMTHLTLRYLLGY